MVVVQSEAGFLENWLQFAAVHRARTAFMLERFLDEDLTLQERGSIGLSMLRESASSMEDLARWSVAIRDHVQSADPLPVCLERSQFQWLDFFKILKSAAAPEIALLFELPNLGPGSSDEYERFLVRQAAGANVVAEYALAADSSGAMVANRWLNKEKHGLPFSLGLTDDEKPAILMHQKGIAGTPHLQLISNENLEMVNRWTLRVCLLVGALAGQWYVQRFGRGPDVGWEALTGTDLTTVDSEEVLAALANGPVTSWVEVSLPEDAG